MRDFVNAIARKFHRVARIASRCPRDFPLRQQLIFDLPKHLLVGDVFPPHVLAVIIQQVANFIVQAVFRRKILIDDLFDDGSRLLWDWRFRKQLDLGD